MKTNLEISGSLRQTSPGNVDFYYGGGETAYINIQTAYSTIPIEVREGRKFGVWEDEEIIEYGWFQKGKLNDGDEIKINKNEELYLIILQSSDSIFLVDYRITPKAYLMLNGSKEYHSITINNISNGEYGELVIEQTNNTNKIVFENVAGKFTMPTRIGDKLYVYYTKVNNEIVAYSQVISALGQYSAPSTINDVVVVYYDSQTAQLKWTAPHGDLITDPVYAYDIRYSNSLVDPDIASNWISMKPITYPTIPKDPGLEESFTIVNLPSNQEYYIYIKSYQIILGVKYTSLASNVAYCKTTSNISEEGKVYRIKIDPKAIHSQFTNTSLNAFGEPSELMYIVDEEYRNEFDSIGYPIFHSLYDTYYQPRLYTRNGAYFRVVIDLWLTYVLDKMFITSTSAGAYSIYTISDIGAAPVLIDENRLNGGVKYTTINFNNINGRFVVLQYDLALIASMSTNPVISLDSYGIPDPYYNYHLGKIDNLLIYGTSVSGTPDLIKPVLKRSTERKTISEFLRSNGHFYQSGRLHSKVSGSNIRLYGHPGHFSPINNAGSLVMPSTIEETKFRLNNIPWVYQNGPGYKFIDLLKNTYKPYGLKPIICATGVMDIVRLTWNGNVYDDGTQADSNRYSGMTTVLPKNAEKGLTEYLNVMANPLSYKAYSKWAYALASMFGKVEDTPENTSKYVWSSSDYPIPEPLSTGLDLLGGVEVENEEDKSWKGFTGFHLPEQVYALQSSCWDGHEDKIKDESNDTSVYGAKKIDPDFKLPMGGLAGNSSGYLLWIVLQSKEKRSDRKLPITAFNCHLYFSDLWLYDNIINNVTTAKAVTAEDSLEKNYFTKRNFDKSLNIRNYYAQSTEFWVTEFGYGETGKRDGKCQYQCYSQPGSYIGDWLIPDRHRSDVKGAWTVRAALTFLRLGVDAVNTYITFGDSNWWDLSGGGSGQEMFRWDELTDLTPGKKVSEISQYELNYDKSGFSGFGFFGQSLLNGGYPISRSYWYISVFRNTLKDYIYLGTLEHETSEKIMILCFRKKDENKGAYAIYYNDSINTGIKDVSINIPSGNSTATKVTEYVPKLPDPLKVSNTRGTDQFRTGLPTTRKEKYIGGEWVIQNRKPDDVNYESFALSAATYPDDPQEGDIVVVLPTEEENPYFPIVGPVCAKQSGLSGGFLGANQYDVQVTEGGDTHWTYRYNAPKLSWRQADAVADYIDYTIEGLKGEHGISEILEVVGGKITTNVSEFPQYILFDGIPETSYKSQVTELSSKSINSTSIQLWWNNNNPEDTSYEIFISNLPESGYSKYTEVLFGSNTAIIGGLLSDTTYYFKVRPIRNSDIGQFSDYISARPYSFIPDINDFGMSSRTTSSISLTWDYESSPISDFYGFGIYKNTGNGIFNLLEIVDNLTTHTYTDTNLISGTYYTYKIRAIGLNGVSNYTEELQIRTLTQDEASPVVISASTDKLGNYIAVTFNIAIDQPELNISDVFNLTEAGESRIIKYVMVDTSNPETVILGLPSDSLLVYDKGKQLKIAYAPIETKKLYSAFGIEVDSFSNIKVTNQIGNFTNILAQYNLNFMPSGSAEPDTGESYWNNFIGDASIGSIEKTTLIDSYGIIHNRSIKSFWSSSTLSWGGGLSQGLYSGTDIPQSIYLTLWLTARGSKATENYTAKLLLSNLDINNKFKFIMYGSRRNAGQPVKIKCNGRYSPSLSVNNNISNFIELDDLSPNGDGTMTIEIITNTDVTDNGSINFAYLTEYLNSSTDPNAYVFLRGLSIQEDPESTGEVSTSNIHIIYNIIGIATHYKLATTEEGLDLEEWVEISDTLQYDIPGEYGTKTIFAKFKNSISESNVKSITFEFKDPYVLLELTGIYINSDSSTTYSRNVTLTVSKLGDPTFYRVSESSSAINDLDWEIFTSTTIPFVLSETSGMKTVYFQLKDNITESIIKSDSIMYTEVQNKTINIELDLPEEIDPSLVSLTFPILKFNKKFAFSWITDDSYNIYQMFLSPINKRFTVTSWPNSNGGSFYVHLDTDYTGYTSGYQPTKFLQITDGTGIYRRFAVSVSTWPSKFVAQGTNIDVGKNWPWISKKDFEYHKDFGNTLIFHDLEGYSSAVTTQSQFDECVSTTVNMFKDQVGISPKFMAEPNGDHKYITWSLGNGSISAITALGGDSRIKLVYPYTDMFSLDKDDVTIQRLFWTISNETYYNSLLSTLNSFNSSLTDTSIYWLIGSSHNPDSAIPPFITQIDTLYGASGLDNIWFPTVDEMYEYWFLRKNTIISKSVSGQKITFSLSIPEIDNFWFKDISVIAKGISTLSGITISHIGDVYGFSYAMQSDGLLININYDDTLIDRVEKYLTIYENNPDKVYADEDALYFIQMLKPGLKDSYMERYNAVKAAPVLKTFELIEQVSGGMVSTSIFSNMTYIGNATHYMMSENSNFSGGSWVVINNNPSTTISDIPGSKTIYIKLKNSYGESTVMSYNTYYFGPDIILNSILINNGDSNTENRTISVITSKVGYPTHYMISESSDFSGSDWNIYTSDPISYSVIGDIGDIVIYVKMKNSRSESLSVSDSIILVEEGSLILNSVTLNSGSSEIGTQTLPIDITYTGTPTHYRVGVNADISDGSWIIMSGPSFNYTTSLYGYTTVYVQIKNNTHESNIISSTITVIEPVVLTSILLYSGASTHEGLTVPVSLNYSGGIPTQMRYGTTSDLSSSSWVTFNSNFNYTFSSYGVSTLYVQLINLAGSSNIEFDLITTTEPPIKVLLGFNDNTNISTDRLLNTVTSNSETICQWNHSVNTTYGKGQLKSSTGISLPWYVNCNSSTYYVANSVFAQSGTYTYINTSTNIALSDTGIYGIATYSKSVSVGDYSADGLNKSRMSLNLPVGTWRVRILWSTSSTFTITDAQRQTCYYAVYQGTTLLATTLVSNTTNWTPVNNVTFNATLNFTITDSSTPIDLAAWSTSINRRPGWNLLEITKLS